MLRVRLCQKLRLEQFRVPLFTSSASGLSTTANNCRTLNYSSVGQHRFKFTACIQQLSNDSTDFPSADSNSSSGYCIQSITPFRFDDIFIHDTQSNMTRDQVLEQWKQLLERLKIIVDSLHCGGTAVEDVSTIRQMLERHYLAKFLVRPYSYTADDVIDSIPSEPFCDSCNVVKSAKENNLLSMRVNSTSGMENHLCEEKIGNASDCDCIHVHALHSSPKDSSYIINNADNAAVVFQQSCIAQLEHDSLCAVMVLSNGTCNDRLENISTQCDVIDFKWANCIASEIMLSSTVGNESDRKKETNPNDDKRPNRDQLRAVQDYMAENLPKIFEKFSSYQIYTSDVIFENNWYLDKSYTTVGVTSYALEIAKLRLFVHLRYANVKMMLLKITTNELNGTVMVRWRITGIPQVKAIMFWKYLPWANRSSSAVEPEWLDGFSTYFINNAGLIYKHKMDRVIPDEGTEVKKNQTVIEKIASKIAPTPTAPFAT